MGKLALGTGIVGTLLVAASCNELNNIETELKKLDDKEVPAIYREYETVQYQLSDYAIDNTVLWKMDSTKAQAMIKEINDGLQKRSELISKRDSIERNYDIKGYEKKEVDRQRQISRVRMGQPMGELGLMAGSIMGFFGYLAAFADYRYRRRKTR